MEITRKKGQYVTTRDKGIMVILAQKFNSPYHLPMPNITSPKDLTDLEGWDYLH